MVIIVDASMLRITVKIYSAGALRNAAWIGLTGSKAIRRDEEIPSYAMMKGVYSGVKYR